MTTTTIRKKLQEYIRFANDKKLKAIYTILEKEIESCDNWNNVAFVEEMKKRTREMESGKTRTYSWNEVQEKAKQALEKVRSKE